MNVKELIEVLQSFPEDQEVELAIVAPVEGADEITVDRYPVDAVMPWNDDEEGHSHRPNPPLRVGGLTRRWGEMFRRAAHRLEGGPFSSCPASCRASTSLLP